MRNVRRWIWIGLLLGGIGILVSCATTAKVSQIKISSPEKIGTFQVSSLTLEVLDKTPGQKNQKFVQKLEEDLKDELAKNEIKVEEGAEKILRVSVTNIYLVGPGKRFVLGVFAGQSTIETDVTLVDKEGSSLVEFQVTSYGGVRGAIFELDSSQRVTKKLAQEVVSKLKSLGKSQEK